MKGHFVRNALMCGAAVLAATTTASAASARVESVAASVTGSDPGSFPGFDTNVYPGDHAMEAWKRSGEYRWVGYYLPGACHKNASWMGKRSRLVEDGWGTALLYVGQQAWNQRLPGGNATAPGGSRCSLGLVNGPQGHLDANDAIAKARAEGFEHGSVIFLDIERMENVPAQMRDYYRAWAKTVLDDGAFRPGVYAHTHNAQTIYSDIGSLYSAAGVESDPPFWVAGNTRKFDERKLPAQVGHAFADVWQGMLDVVRSHNGVRLPVDINVAAVPDPSAASAGL
jgi:Rv2525c-like, glycoside hydrolase-like domain